MNNEKGKLLIHKYPDFFKSVFLNLLSSIIVMASNQFVVMPIFAQKYSVSDFGQISALYGINSIVFLFLGSALCSYRLIHSEESKKDFVFLNYITSLLAVVMSFFLFLFYSKNLGMFDVFIYSIVTGFASNRQYIISDYRINLDYFKYFLTDLFLTLGLFLGILLFLFFSIPWSLVFFLGELFSLVYYAIDTKFYKEELKKTDKFSLISKEFSIYSFSVLISNICNNLDKFLLIPLLGSVDMAVFFAINTVSKGLNLIVNPFSNVILSYLTKSKKRFSRAFSIRLQFFTFLLSLFLTIPIYFFSKFIINFLYSTVIQNEPHLNLMTGLLVAGSIILSSCILVNSYFLKYYEIKFQTSVQTAYGIIYLLSAIILGKKFGIVGFSVSYFLSALAKFVIQFVFSLKFSSKVGANDKC